MKRLLQECKDELCTKYGALTFEDLLNHSTVKDAADQLAQLYAERYAKEAMKEKTASEKLLIVVKTIEAIRKGAQVEWPEGIEDEIREIASQIETTYNEAIRKAAESAEVKMEEVTSASSGTHEGKIVATTSLITVVDKDSILKLLKK
jgi:hypothetical protein